MRVLYWSLIALLTVLFFPLVAWGIAVTGALGMCMNSPEMGIMQPGLYPYSMSIESDGPSIYAVDSDQQVPWQEPVDERKSVPISQDALPPTTASEILVGMRPEGRREPLGEPNRKLLPQVPQGLMHLRTIGPYLRPYA
jgi:hypothetical protein